MSAQQLADRTSELGFPIARSVLANLESGRRETITVPELFVISAALDVPPILLLVPLGRVDAVEALPDLPISAWNAARWLRGDGLYPTKAMTEAEQVGFDAFHDASRTVSLFIRHEDLMLSLGNTLMRPEPTPEHVDGLERQIRQVRADMRALGLTPPLLPADLRYVEKAGPGA